jgi:3-deoxy-7-phosphoheptulonate synthase
MNNCLQQDWHLTSWKDYPSSYVPDYENQDELMLCLKQLHHYLPLIKVKTIKILLKQLKEAQAGKQFILQAGDCSERFSDVDAHIVNEKMEYFRTLANDISSIHSCMIIARMAGQYAKPRSSSYEIHAGQILPSFYGELINSPEYNINLRKPDPDRLLQAYKNAKQVLQNMEKNNESNQKIYTSHEVLHLSYETALTREKNEIWYNLTTHFPWLGMRTERDSPAHLEYFRGIANPIAVKLGPHVTTDRLLFIINQINPYNIPGKLTLIHRIGQNAINTILPSWIKAVNKYKKSVLWLCDPMHGNTEKTANGIKTRYLSSIIDELEKAFRIHYENSSYLHGIHLETTLYPVTECIGENVKSEKDLKHNYQSEVDPRLNPEQTNMIINITKKWLSKKLI